MIEMFGNKWRALRDSNSRPSAQQGLAQELGLDALRGSGREYTRYASGRQSAWLGVWFLRRLSATVVTSRISVRAPSVTWRRTAVAATNGCICWIQRRRNALSSSRKEWQLRLFVRS